MILKIENASFGYRSDDLILQAVNFEIRSGELMAVLGPNGAGKTTLLRCLLGSLQWKGGRCTLDGQEITYRNQRELLQQTAYVPQSRGTASTLSAADMILLGRTRRLNVFETPSAEDRTHVRETAERLKIAHLLDKRCNEISGGELQMVLIARALAAEPKLMILDEPESNLDFRNQLIVLDTLSGLAAEGICCIFNTHYPGHALTRADKTLLLPKRGTPIFGETQKILNEENIAEIFGVKAVIGTVESEGRTFKSIMPVSLTSS